MIKEFLENVQRLYDETVQDKSVRTNQSAADLLDVSPKSYAADTGLQRQYMCACDILQCIGITGEQPVEHGHRLQQ